MRTLAALSIAVLAASGCDILDPGWSRQLGLVVEDPHHFHSLIAPDVVTQGHAFSDHGQHLWQLELQPGRRIRAGCFAVRGGGAAL